MMIYVGIDDTDTLDDPGTNQLARHLVRELAPQYRGRMIVRHQLLEDPRVPCTKKNGCASIIFDACDAANVHALIERLREIIVPWCPNASDPGMCVATAVPQIVIDWGLRCKRELVTQAEAHKIAVDARIHLEGLGGTHDGVIGALAAIGLMATKNDGRVVHFGSDAEDWYDVTGCLTADEIRACGVDEIRLMGSGELMSTGTVDVGKRLRPNYRDGKIVLFVARNDQLHWEAVRLV
jgi:hypothetical protein